MSKRNYQAILSEHSERVAKITLNRPQKRNAIGPLMVNELLYALADAFEDGDVGVVEITGAGKAFCAGGDFSQMSGGEKDELPLKGDYADLLLQLLQAPKPVIARVNGHAMGGGLGIVAASTFAVAATGAKLGTPEINVGLFPMMIMKVLAKHVPRRRLLEMMVFGERIEAAEAASLGLVNSAVAPEELDGAVGAIREKILSKSPLILKLGLEAFTAQDEMPTPEALKMLNAKLGECLTTQDAQEGLMAFLQKRQPKWQGR